MGIVTTDISVSRDGFISAAGGAHGMSLPSVVSQDEWQTAAEKLLVREKELTGRRDELSAERRQLPMVEVTKDYVFDGPNGEASLLDRFEGRGQLIVDHYMWERDWDDGCPSCAGRVDQYGSLEHLHDRETTIAVISCVPLAKIEPFKQRKGWTFPWYSSYGNDFNYDDCHVTLDEAVAPVMDNYRDKAELAGLQRWLSPEGHS